MTKEQAIELINNSDNCYSLWDAEELLEDCKFKIRQNFTSNRWYIMATDIYEVEDGYIDIALLKQVNMEPKFFGIMELKYISKSKYEEKGEEIGDLENDDFVPDVF